MQHGFSVYQDQVYVPLIIKYPNSKDASVVDDLVNSVDLMPTVLDVLGYETPREVQGQTLLKLETVKSRFIISESYPNPFIFNWHQRFDRLEKAIYSGSFKFIQSTLGKRELYNLSEDPDEKENLYDEVDNISQGLEVLLNDWLLATEAEMETSLTRQIR